MALNIKDAATDRLAREVAREAGESITTAVNVALQERLERLRRDASVDERLRRIDEIVTRFNERPVLDDRSPDEIIGYNEHGHFD